MGSRSDWFIAEFAPDVIGRSNYLDIDFSTFISEHRSEHRFFNQSEQALELSYLITYQPT